MQPLVDQPRPRAQTFDVIAAEDNPLAVLRFPAGVATVLTEHEAVRAPAREWRAVGLAERPLRALRARDWRRWDSYLPTAWRRFDLLQVYCEGDAAAVRRLAPEMSGRIRVNPYGIELPEPMDPAHEQPGTILFAGTFAHLPNRDAARWLAGEIMPAIRRRHPAAQLRLVGSAPPREVLDLAGPGVEVIADAAQHGAPPGGGRRRARPGAHRRRHEDEGAGGDGKAQGGGDHDLWAPKASPAWSPSCRSPSPGTPRRLARPPRPCFPTTSAAAAGLPRARVRRASSQPRRLGRAAGDRLRGSAAGRAGGEPVSVAEYLCPALQPARP